MLATPPRAHRTLAALLLALASACSGGGGAIIDSNNNGNGSVNSVTVSPGTASVNVGATTQLSASVSVTGNASTAVTWSSSNAAVASVTGNGASATVTGVGAGTATITATSAVNSARTGSSIITVTAPVIASITLSSTASTLRVGQTLQVTAVARDAANNVISNPTLTWSSSNTALATVSTSGLVTGVAPGAVTITARSGTINSNALALSVTASVTVASWSSTRAIPSSYLPSTGAVWDIWSPSTTPAYAVLDDGKIARWDGTSWTTVDQNAGAMYGIAGVSATEIYAVGANGVIRKFDGTTWTTMISNTNVALYDIWLSSSGNGFAVGTSGLILRMTNGVWAPISSGTTQTLWGVFGSSATNVFAVGDGGVITRFTGGATFATVASGTLNPLYGVWSNSAGFAVAVGLSGTIRVWNGATWGTGTSGTTNSLFAVSGDPATGTIATVGQNSTVLLSTTGTATTTWTASPPGFVNDSYNAVWRNDGIGVLVGLGANIAGVLRRSTAGSWSITTIAPNLNGAAVVNATTAYVAGDYGSYSTFVGGVWQTQFGAGGTYNYFSQLYAPSATALYGARFSGSWSLNNGSWTPVYEPATTSYVSVGGTGPSDVYVSGSLGTMARFNGATWAAVNVGSVGPTETVRRIAGQQGAADGLTFFAGYDNNTGNSGFILRQQSGFLTRMSVPTTQGLWAVCVLDNTLAFAVGNSGVIMRYNGTQWSLVTSNTTVQLRSCWIASATEAYAVGAGGTIMRYDGTTWSSMVSGTTVNLREIHGVSGVMAVAVGEGMTVVRGTPTAAVAASAQLRSEPRPSSRVRQAASDPAAGRPAASRIPR